MPSTSVRRGLYWSESTRTWHYEFRFHGAKKNGDTGHAHEKLAREWLTAFKGRLADAEVGLVAQGPAPTLQQALRQWLEEWGPRVGARHRVIVETAITQHLRPLLATPLPMLTTPVVNRAVAEYLAGEGHSEGGANVLLRSLKVVMRYALRARRIRELPYTVPMLSVQERPRRALTPKDVGTLLAKLQELGAPDQALDQVRLMVGLGVRVSEACLARVEALDLERATFTPWDPDAGTKGGEAVALPVPRWLLPRLKELVGDRKEGYILRGARSETPGRQLAWAWLKRARIELKWPWLHPHELRAAYATMLSEKGMATKGIQTLLRHKDPRTTDKYLRKDLTQAREKLDLIGIEAGLPSESPISVESVTINSDQSPSSPRGIKIRRSTKQKTKDI